MNNEKLKLKVDLLHTQAGKLLDRFLEKNKSTQIEECNSLNETICECLPILLTAKEAKCTARIFLQIIDRVERDTFQLIVTSQRIVDSLNCFFVCHEAWPKVEAYAQEETTVDFDLHEMAVLARKIVLKIEEKRLNIDPMFYALLGEQPSGQYNVLDSEEYRSAFGLTTGVHFFEALLLMNEISTIGWKTGGSFNGKGGLIGKNKRIKQTYDPIDDQHSIGFSSASFPPGTVLGCLLDFTQRTFAFTVNGRKINIPKKAPFSSNAYYVQVKGDLVYLNFGQVPFKYPPRKLAARPTTDQINRYALYKDVNMPIFDNRVEPYFADETQKKVKETLDQLWGKGEISKEAVAVVYEELWAKESFHTETYGLRWMQAILEMENIAEGRINEMASLVEALVEFASETWDIEFRAFIVPYSKLKVNQASTEYRTMAILFATIVHYKTHFYAFKSYPDSSSPFLSFLLSAFLTTTDPITAMFTTIGMETVNTNDPIATMFTFIKLGLIPKKVCTIPLATLFTEDGEEWLNTELREKLQYWEEIIGNTIANTKNVNSSLAQLHLVIRHFEHSFFSSFAPHLATPTSLSPSKCSSQAKLSSNSLSLRSDFQWQSACSHLAVDNSLSLEFPIFYFEATLLTSGPMRIGWATQRWQIEGTKLGNSEFSFGYDGHTGCIWHQDVQIQVKNTAKWKTGDVIGCQLDLDNKQFTFYQNGERIQTNGAIYSRVSKKNETSKKIMTMLHVYERNDSLQPMTPFISKHPYHAALSLGQYQQVTVNFGHTFFRFPPKCLDVWDFKQYSEYLEVPRPNKGSKSVNISSATNAIINIESKTTTGNVSINQSVASPNPTTEEPPFLIKEPTVCGVCQKSSTVRLRTLKDCTHFAFCVRCAPKKLLVCRKCPP